MLFYFSKHTLLLALDQMPPKLPIKEAGDIHGHHGTDAGIKSSVSTLR